MDLGRGFRGQTTAWDPQVSEHTEQGQVVSWGAGKCGVVRSAPGLCLEMEFGKGHRKFRFWSMCSGVEFRKHRNRN